jgi:hypothetical protein
MATASIDKTVKIWDTRPSSGDISLRITFRVRVRVRIRVRVRVRVRG